MPYPSAVNDPELDRLAGHVAVTLRADTRLEGGGVWVDYDGRSISVYWLRGGALVEATLSDARWWDPPTLHRGHILAQRLAIQLLEQTER